MLWSVIQGGAFATGLLILSTQIDVALEFGSRMLEPSQELDVRLVSAVMELWNDVLFEAIGILSWRLFLARQTVAGN